MKSQYDVLKGPILTEKAVTLKDNRQICLEVARWANKKQVREAAQKLFKVNVDSVRTMICRGKVKRVKKNAGKQQNWKKAIVTLAEGSDLDVFGVVANVPASKEQE